MFLVFHSARTTPGFTAVRHSTFDSPCGRWAGSRRGAMSADLASRPRRLALPRATDRIAIGAKGLAISPICLGWVRDPDTIAAAFDAGINFFFVTGDLHWPIYEGTRRGLAALLRRNRGVREQIVVAVASYVAQPEFARGPFQEVLESVPRLGRIDMIVVGGAHGHDFPARRERFREYVDRGEFGARAIGTSFHDRAAALRAINHAQIDLAFVRYNPAHPGARSDLFPALQPSPARIFNFKSMAGHRTPGELRALGLGPELWRPRPTDYYRFALSSPEIDGILCALRDPRQVAALGRALASPPLDADEERYLIDLAKLSTGKARLI
jgi:aryl-alcohol dehydrogenase-like predicted oxidoreductase